MRDESIHEGKNIERSRPFTSWRYLSMSSKAHPTRETMATRALLLLLLSALLSVAAAGRATTATAFADRKPLALDGSDDAADDDFEFDLDLSSTLKRKRRNKQLDGEHAESAVEVTTSVDGSTQKRAPRRDFSTKVVPSGFNFGRGTGYVAAQEILEGDVLFSVPFVDVMTVNSAHHGRIKALLDANPDLPASIALALHLLEERFRGEASPFHEYIETLPTSMALNGTLFYSEEEMTMLRGSHLHRVTAGRIQAVNNFYEALAGPVTSLALDPPLFSKDQFTNENFAWALGTVWTRAYSPTGKDDDVMMAPILDTIGVCVDAACPSSRIEWDRHEQRVVVYATQDYAIGEEVLLNLGSDKPSIVLMLNHGFARSQPYTEAETFDISIFLDPNDTLVDVKKHILEANNMSINGSYVLRYKSKELDPRLARSLKLQLLSAAELDKYTMLLDTSTPEVPIVSLRNEYVYTRAVVLACKNLLANYPTTLEHDRAKLRELEANYRDRRTGVADKKLQVLRALVIEKEILRHTMGLATTHWSDLLTLSDPTFLGL